MQYRDRIVGLEYHDAASLTPHPGNWRNHGKEQVEALRGVLAEVGIADTILAYRSERNGGKLTVIDGHLRRDAAPQQWPVLVLDVSDAEADYILATHDPLAAMANADAAALDALLDTVNSGEAAVQAMLAALAEDAGLYEPSEQDPNELWQGMPEFEQEDKRPFQSVHVHFKCAEDRDRFAALVGQLLTDKTRYIWYPEIEIERYADKTYGENS